MAGPTRDVTWGDVLTDDDGRASSGDQPRPRRGRREEEDAEGGHARHAAHTGPAEQQQPHPLCTYSRTPQQQQQQQQQQ